ncbi:Fur family zinc uptake transcriptional regulator [Rhodovulum sulfidophilum]|uniref:Fur family transcriptional regulator n=1 Tax=Rhodovulum sulfidophilum TaxID=35806 RepID=UPI0005A7EAE1|nr:Fur family transcriptional regulator [Rhodovulum sulfidophilum]ANB33783.1 Fur family transcriptional regulator [Rhodovulum sulfidophilum DSM 1374]ANB37605.1 Fur family transcriptional regulator [Rhodovulum sulfidophilum]MCW2304112.1 Fur family zinc uptake transcriptional regulator [Rhodovulum sulfidophilum]
MRIDAERVFSAHDHAACRRATLERAEEIVAAEGLRLTPVRRRTLEILLESHQALGAYEVLDRLVASGFARQPPVAYRALDFLVDHGLAHRIRRLNAFAACMRPGEPHRPAFLICDTCHAVAEAPGTAVADAMLAAAGTVGFEIERMSLEAVGRCPACRESRA